jgi:hypothetical protein
MYFLLSCLPPASRPLSHQRDICLHCKASTVIRLLSALLAPLEPLPSGGGLSHIEK